ncbi:MAG: TMEM43 family protein [Planctomycetaceae bacterium]|nr:TMEM43 family protein [Planctomycetaceae bacterium]
MNNTVTVKTGWLERMKNSFGGIIVGIILIAAGTVLLWWNEGNFVKTRAALNEAQSVTSELENINEVNNANNGQLVHAIGAAETQEELKDPFFGVTTVAIRLERAVEFFQWVEHKKTETRTRAGGGEEKKITYSYTQEWTRSPVESSQFGLPGASEQHKNTVLGNLDKNLKEEKQQAENVTFGAYRLPEFLIDDIRGSEPLAVELSAEVVADLSTKLGASDSSSMVHVNGNTVYLGSSPATPQIGDIRVTFKQVLPATVSLIAKLCEDTFEPYVAANGRHVGMLSVGTHSLENMYSQAHSGNAIITWILRLVGFLAVFIGLTAITAPLAVLASVIPFLGNLVGVGTWFFSLLFAVTWSLLVIAVAWLFYRPIIGIILLVVAVGLVVLYSRSRSGKTGVPSV